MALVLNERGTDRSPESVTVTGNEAGVRGRIIRSLLLSCYKCAFVESTG